MLGVLLSAACATAFVAPPLGARGRFVAPALSAGAADSSPRDAGAADRRPSRSERASRLDEIDEQFWSALRRAVGPPAREGSLDRFEGFCANVRDNGSFSPWSRTRHTDPHSDARSASQHSELPTGQLTMCNTWPGLRARPFWRRASERASTAARVDWRYTARDDEPAPRSEEIAPPEDGDGDGFAWLGELEAHAQEIADELARVAIMGQSGSTGEYWRSGFYNGEHNGGFQLLDLINDDTPREDMREAFPKTFDAIQRSGAPFGPRLVAFGRMKPHTWLPRHSDKCNYLLTAHIPLPIPKTAFAPSARTAEALDIVAIRHALDSHSRKEQAKGRACPSPLTRAGLAGITVADEANAWVTSEGVAERAVVADTTCVSRACDGARARARARLAVRRSHPTRGVSAQLSAQRVQRRRGGRVHPLHRFLAPRPDRRGAPRAPTLPRERRRAHVEARARARRRPPGPRAHLRDVRGGPARRRGRIAHRFN